MHNTPFPPPPPLNVRQWCKRKTKCIYWSVPCVSKNVQLYSNTNENPKKIKPKNPVQERLVTSRESESVLFWCIVCWQTLSERKKKVWNKASLVWDLTSVSHYLSNGQTSNMNLNKKSDCLFVLDPWTKWSFANMNHFLVVVRQGSGL